MVQTRKPNRFLKAKTPHVGYATKQKVRKKYKSRWIMFHLSFIPAVYWGAVGQMGQMGQMGRHCRARPRRHRRRPRGSFHRSFHLWPICQRLSRRWRWKMGLVPRCLQLQGFGWGMPPKIEARSNKIFLARREMLVRASLWGGSRILGPLPGPIEDS